LYLWHWPIILFQHMTALQPRNASNHTIKGSIVIVAFIVATLSWRFVETPFRKGKFMLKGANAFRFAGVSAAALAGLACALIFSHGLPFRYSQRQLMLASFLDNTSPGQEGVCSIESGGGAKFNVEHCLYQDPSRKNYLLIGDSHAAHLWYGLQKTFPEINFQEASASGCEPSVSRKPDRTVFQRLDRHLFTEFCRPLMDYVYQDYLRTHHPDRILLAARWEPDALPRVEETIHFLKARGFDVLLFGPIVQYDADLPLLLVDSLRKKDPNLPLRHRLTDLEGLDQQRSALAARDGAEYVSYFKMLCHGEVCAEFANGDTPLQSDYGHLTTAGSLLVCDRLKADRSMYGPSKTDVLSPVGRLAGPPIVSSADSRLEAR
jgi:hypothetical protein